jgi:hypothetical protein
MTWTGWDGSVWDLTNADRGVFIENGRGLRGLSMPEHERWSRSAPLVPGSVHVGHQVKDRTVLWPLVIYSDESSEGWVAIDRAFWRTMDPDREGTWTVTHPNGERRYLKCRFLDDNNHTWQSDQMLKGWDRYSLTLLAEYPYWRGPIVTRSFQQPDPVDFADPEDEPVISISSASSLASASISNPGDIDASVTWWLHGPFTEAEVGVGDRTVDIPFALVEGETLVVDTNPTARTAKLIETPDLTKTLDEQMAFVDAQLRSATNKTKDLGAATNMNGRVPSGEDQPISVSMTGSGEVRALLTPSYRRAW